MSDALRLLVESYAERSTLAHNGVKGMHWGIRKDESGGGRSSGKSEKSAATPILTKSFSGGESVSIYKDPTPPMAKILAKLSPAIRNNLETSANFTLKDKDGTTVGDASFTRVSKDELNLVWVGIKTKHRGKGYASAALDGVVKYAQAEGVKKLTLEVPGNAPDARHIYEKLGFRDDPVLQKKLNDSRGEDASVAENDPYWGGLSAMSLKVNTAKHADLESDAWERKYADEFAQMLIDNAAVLR